MEHRTQGPPRGGGAAGDFLFELTGGSLCLDLANTLDRRPTRRPRERLESYDDLLQWARQAGGLSDAVARRLSRRAAAHPAEARRVLQRARRLREAVFRVFAARAREMPAPGSELRLLNERLPAALARLRLVEAGPHFRWQWSGEQELDRMLWPVVQSAAELLTSPRLGRVRVCAAEECDWLFLDQSKNRSRRWCDMTVCGNRNKVRRFRRERRSDS